MKNILTIFQITISVLLIACIVLQAKGTGLGITGFLSGELYSSKRGIEKVIFISTIVFTVVFAAISLGMLLN